MADAVPDRTIQHLAMLARLYVEALLVDENLADQVRGYGVQGLLRME